MAMIGEPGVPGTDDACAPLANHASIVWETAATASATTARPDRSRTKSFNENGSPISSFIRRRINRLYAVLTNPTFLQLHGRSPLETSRIATTSVADAAHAIGRSHDVRWGGGRTAGQLLLRPLRVATKELGQPHVADGTLHAHGMRRLQVTVAIYRYGNERCGIQIRPRYRRPRTARRLRQCLRSTHGAADRLRDIVLTVDFMPPVADVVA